MPTAADITRMTYNGAEKLRREQRPGGDPSKLDFGTVPTCFNCDLPIMGRKVRPIQLPILAYH
jgi:YD repeat-containing protein